MPLLPNEVTLASLGITARPPEADPRHQSRRGGIRATLSADNSRSLSPALGRGAQTGSDSVIVIFT